ncbi:HalOD1 output domain-containing protein [Halovenus amylolytica]|uniref:HalOD1 output domain-containing protein n=1 Tax=Halovenus amylolytica TaxID=2500550 RepID=UPI003620685F
MTTTVPEPQVACRLHHDWDGDTDVNMTVLEAVAEVTDADLVELPPLYDHIDPDALEAVFTHTAGNRQVAGSVSFQFAGYPITVHASGEVVVYAD